MIGKLRHLLGVLSGIILTALRGHPCARSRTRHPTNPT
jgi:hypothetical protein